MGLVRLYYSYSNNNKQFCFVFISRTIFFVAALPNMISGFHVWSYVFVGKMPNRFWCEIPELNNTTWTDEQKLYISLE